MTRATAPWLALAAVLLSTHAARAMASAPAAQSSTARAVAAGARGESAAALATLKARVAVHPSTDLHYNVGTLALQLGRHAEAVQHLLAAARHAPARQDVRHNLAAALGAAGLAQTRARAAVRQLVPQSAFDAAPGRALDGAMGLGVLALAAALASLGRARKRTSALTAAAGALLTTLGGGIWAARAHRANAAFVVVTADDTAGLAGPQNDAQRTLTLAEGRAGVARGTSGVFTRVLLDEGVETWVRTADVQRVPK